MSLKAWERSAIGVLLLLLPALARAGELPAHDLAGQQACTAVQGMMLGDGKMFPLTPAECGYWAQRPDHWKASTWLQNAADVLPVQMLRTAAFEAAGPPELQAHIRSILGNNLTALASIDSNTAMLGMWYHFMSHVANAAGLWNANITRAQILLNAKTSLIDSRRADNSCPTRATRFFFQQVLAASHLTQDENCRHHEGGNNACSPANDATSAACGLRVAVIGAHVLSTRGSPDPTVQPNQALGPNGRVLPLACDEAVLLPARLPRNLPAVRRGPGGVGVVPVAPVVRPRRVLGAVAIGLAVTHRLVRGSLSGLERLYGHHCQIFNPSLACGGNGPPFLMPAQPQYCECQILMGGNANGSNRTGDTTYVDGAGLVNPSVAQDTLALINLQIGVYNSICAAPMPQACGMGPGPVDAACDAYCRTADTRASNSESSLLRTATCVPMGSVMDLP